LVPENWQEGDPIKVLVEFKEMTDEEYDAALQLNEFTGVVRNIWWEGVTTKQLGYFDEQYQITFPEKPLLIEYTGYEHNDAYAIWVFGGVEVIFILILLFMWIRMRKAKSI